MAGDWIKMEVSTPDKREVLDITFQMGWDDPDQTLGKLLRVWRWFDQHTVGGNAPNVSAALLDRVIGTPGFAQAMANVGWLEISTSGIQLPNFGRHNGKTAKERALTAKRVANHKGNATGNDKGNAEANDLFNDEANAGSVSVALPREEKNKEEKNTPLPPKGGEEDPPGFAEAWKAYPKREGGDSRRDAVKAWSARLREGATPEALLDGVRRYHAHLTAKGKVGTEFVKRASTFFGPGQHYAEDFGAHGSSCGDWWTSSGFPNQWEAESAGCTAASAHCWRDGKRVREAA